VAVQGPAAAATRRAAYYTLTPNVDCSDGGEIGAAILSHLIPRVAHTPAFTSLWDHRMYTLRSLSIRLDVGSL
jgi:hypothetical protein